MAIMKRFINDGCPSGFNRVGDFDNFTCQRSNWSFWGRWVLLGICILFVLVLMAGYICMRRRNRKRGVTPSYGTGWFGMGGSNKPNDHQTHNNHQSGYQQGGYNQNGYGQQGYTSPPPYGPPFNPNDGYYGGQQQQYGLQPLLNAHYPDGQYQPPVVK